MRFPTLIPSHMLRLGSGHSLQMVGGFAAHITDEAKVFLHPNHAPLIVHEGSSAREFPSSFQNPNINMPSHRSRSANPVNPVNGNSIYAGSNTGKGRCCGGVCS